MVIESIKVEAYRCPYHDRGCDYLSLDKTDADEHAQMPVLVFPAGLVLKYQRGPILDFVGDLILLANSRFSNEHVSCHHLLHYRIKERLFNTGTRFDFENAHGIIARVEEGEYALLTPEEIRKVQENPDFEKCRQREGIERFVFTSPLLVELTPRTSGD